MGKRGKNNQKNPSTFFTINEGFLLLQHLLRDIAMLILLQTVFSPFSDLIGTGKEGSRAYGQSIHCILHSQE